MLLDHGVASSDLYTAASKRELFHIARVHNIDLHVDTGKPSAGARNRAGNSAIGLGSVGGSSPPAERKVLASAIGHGGSPLRRGGQGQSRRGEMEQLRQQVQGTAGRLVFGAMGKSRLHTSKDVRRQQRIERFRRHRALADLDKHAAHEAAALMQAVWRGHRARTQYSLLRHHHALRMQQLRIRCARHLQSAWRRRSRRLQALPQFADIVISLRKAMTDLTIASLVDDLITESVLMTRRNQAMRRVDALFSPRSEVSRHSPAVEGRVADCSADRSADEWVADCGSNERGGALEDGTFAEAEAEELVERIRASDDTMPSAGPVLPPHSHHPASHSPSCAAAPDMPLAPTAASESAPAARKARLLASESTEAASPEVGAITPTASDVMATPTAALNTAGLTIAPMVLPSSRHPELAAAEAHASAASAIAPPSPSQRLPSPSLQPPPSLPLAHVVAAPACALLPTVLPLTLPLAHPLAHPSALPLAPPARPVQNVQPPTGEVAERGAGELSFADEPSVCLKASTPLGEALGLDEQRRMRERHAIRETARSWMEFTEEVSELGGRLAADRLECGPTWQETLRWATWMIAQRCSQLSMHSTSIGWGDEMPNPVLKGRPISSSSPSVPLTAPADAVVGTSLPRTAPQLASTGTASKRAAERRQLVEERLEYAQSHVLRALYPGMRAMPRGEWRLYWARVHRSFERLFTRSGRRAWSDVAAAGASASAIRAGLSSARQRQAATSAIKLVNTELRERRPKPGVAQPVAVHNRGATGVK